MHSSRPEGASTFTSIAHEDDISEQRFADGFERTGAVIVGDYRYALWRVWDPALPCSVFILLNPSTADARQDDATLRRCVNFATSWHYGSVELVNLFAFRSRNPATLTLVADAVGPENDAFIGQAIARASLIICAWGAFKSPIKGRDRQA